MGTRLMVMAGGTGGHVFPALAVAELLRAQGMEVSWIGTSQGMEAQLVPQHGFELDAIPVSGLRGKGLRTLLAAPYRLALALWAAARVLRRRRPSVVLGMGGFVAGPGGAMAWLLRRPLVIHEQNRIPGLTNQWLARLATRVFEAFPGSFAARRHAETCGNPVRPRIVALPPPAERFRDRTGAARLLVLGGSLGAKALNEIVPLASAELPQAQRPEIRHQCGERTIDVARAAYAAAGVAAELVPFIDDMAEAYGWADLVVCRAGALTVSELAAAGVGAVLVPYPFAVDDHQVANARVLSDVGAARLIRQEDLVASDLAELLAGLLADRNGLLAMADAARSCAAPLAAEQIAAACWEVARR
jgi:UDP-N-acetylglucosamine--N-acetylmuramyl-(pentapeptide) pyrophosphoryl-undecaprenol N-acetylglucosamine transferase